MLLPVSAPFHCALMKAAAEVMADALSKVSVKPPVVPVVANVLAKPIQDPAEIVRALVAQVTGTVRWRESVAFMVGAVPTLNAEERGKAWASWSFRSTVW
jgi:[acyl-carrier-protein] S-malonyltransferase